MKTKFLWLTVAILILVLGLLMFTDSNEEAQIPDENISESQKVENVAVEFINNFIIIAPPAVNVEAEDRLLNTLSEKALSGIDREMLATEMASFIGVQDIPSQGVKIGTVKLLDEESAVLGINLLYSGGTIEKNINLIKESGKWKVDSVVNKNLINFLETGNITKDNPGYPENVWHLIYEEQGSPAVTKALIFNSENICSVDDKQSECDPDSLVVGTKVEIRGYENEDGVEVKDLKVLE